MRSQVIVEFVFAFIAFIDTRPQRTVTVKYDINIDVAAKLEYESI